MTEEQNFECDVCSWGWSWAVLLW